MIPLNLISIDLPEQTPLVVGVSQVEPDITTSSELVTKIVEYIRILLAELVRHEPLFAAGNVSVIPTTAESNSDRSSVDEFMIIHRAFAIEQDDGTAIVSVSSFAGRELVAEYVRISEALVTEIELYCDRMEMVLCEIDGVASDPDTDMN